MNRFKETYEMLGEHEASRQLIEFLEESKLTLYGVSLQPSKLRKMRHNLMLIGKRVEELQK